VEWLKVKVLKVKALSLSPSKVKEKKNSLYIFVKFVSNP
jgi:hypothetical protein